MFSNVLLVDSQVHGYQTFVDSVNASTFPVVFDSTTTKSSILSLLQERFTKIDRIGIVFEGQPLYMFLDSQPLFRPNEISPFSENVQFIIEIIQQFNIKNIDYLGCNTLIFPEWRSYYDIIQTNTNVIVGASNDMTGNIQYGGDWVMETTGTDIELIYFTSSIGYYKYLLGSSSEYTIVLSSNGDIYGCGINNYGQLGDGTIVDRSTLVKMINNTGKTPKSITSGAYDTIVLMTDGTIYGCGFNYFGELGNGSTTEINTLTQMTNNTGKTPKSISSGGVHTIVLMTDGTIFGCGYNFYGQLGNVTNSNNDTTGVTSLIQMTNNTGKTPKSISCGEYHTIVLMTDGTIYGCGINGQSQLGNGNGNDSIVTPSLTQMTNITGKTPKSVSCGANHTIVLMSDGTIYGCGVNNYGQLGNTTDSRTLIQITMPNGKTAESITSGAYDTIVLMTDGTIYGCGFNYFGELGNGSTTEINTLTQMTNNTGKTPKSISSGGVHTIVLMTDGTIYGCGINNYGHLGIGNTTDSSTLTQMKGVGGVGFITDIVSLSDGTIPPTSPPCFKEGSLILTIDGYVPIENLRKGDLVKTLNHDYVPIDMIGKKDILHSASQERIKRQLYKCTQSEYPEVFEDLLITGCHSILVDDFTSEEQREKTIEVNGDTYVTDGKYRLPACADSRSSVYETPGTYTIYHFALENDDYYMNYGIYANGLLVETTSKRYLKELSNMMLL